MMINQSLTELEIAFASDPRASEAKTLRDETIKNLEELRARLEANHTVGKLNPVWELDRQTMGDVRIFNHPLPPKDSKTLQVILKIRDSIFNEITQPRARIEINECIEAKK